jgi:deoxyribose-phosphate aldolase
MIKNHEMTPEAGRGAFPLQPVPFWVFIVYNDDIGTGGYPDSNPGRPSRKKERMTAMDQKTIDRIVKICDHTLLKPESTWEQIRDLCDDAIAYGTATVCIPPCYARQAAAYLDGKIPVCVVIGFPNGNATTASKVFEAKDAIANGASEVDMVINVGWVKDGLYDKVLEEIKKVKEAVEGRTLKVIIETCLLTREEKIKMCEVVGESGADFIKTSTGFNAGGATFEDVALLRKYSPAHVKVKAAGGIASLEDAEKFMELGADRLGTSRIIRILKSQKHE